MGLTQTSIFCSEAIPVTRDPTQVDKPGNCDQGNSVASPASSSEVSPSPSLVSGKGGSGDDLESKNGGGLAPEIIAALITVPALFLGALGA